LISLQVRPLDGFLRAMGLLGEWMKYNKNYFYLFIPFFFDQPAGQTLGRIFTRDSSKDVKSRKDVPFWDYKT